MKNFYFNLNQLPSKNDGGQSCDGNRQSRLMSQSGCSAVDVPMTSYGAPDEHPMSIRSASDGERWQNRGWKYVAMIFAVLVMSIGQAWGVKSTFTKGETIFIYQQTTNSAWRDNADVKAWFKDKDSESGGEAVYTNWLCDGDNSYKVWYVIVPQASLNQVRIQRFEPKTSNCWTGNEFSANQSDRGNDDYNVLWSENSTGGWKNETFGFTLKGSPNSWSGNLATFEDMGDGYFQCTYTYTPTNTQDEFKIYDSWGHAYGRLTDGNNFLLQGLKAGQECTILASFKIQDCSSANRTSLNIMVIHEPGVYTSASGYNTELSTYDSRKYEWYGVWKSGSNNKIEAGETGVNESGAKLVAGFPNSTEKHAGWVYVKSAASTSSDVSATNVFPKLNNAFLVDNSTFLYLCVKGYDQFQIVATDNNGDRSNNKYLKVLVDGKDVTAEASASKTATVRAYSLTASEPHLIGLQTTSTDKSTIWGFSLRLPDCTGPSITSFGHTGIWDGTYDVGTALGTITVTASAGNSGALSYKWYQYDEASGKVKPYTEAAGTNNTASYAIPNDVACVSRHYFCIVSEAGCDKTVESDISGALTLTEPAYDIIYAANLAGAGGGTASTTGKSAGYTEAAKACGYSKSGYKFKWWNTAPDGTGEDFYVGETVTLGTGNLTLYAQWEQVSEGWAYWVGDDVSSSPTDIAGNAVTMRLTRNSVDYNTDLTKGATIVSKYSSTDKHAKVLAVAADNNYLQVHFTDDSPINALKLGVAAKDDGDYAMAVIYSTTADFSSGTGEIVTHNTPRHSQTTKSVTDFSPTTANKYKYARIYRNVATAVYSFTGGSEHTIRIYSIKAQKGTVASTYTDLSVTKDPAAGSATDPTISATSVTQGSGVTVEAGAAASGYAFTGWTSANGTFANESALSTTFTPNADNAVATANYAATKTIVIKIKNDENKDGWTCQTVTTVPAGQGCIVTRDGDWVVATFTGVVAVKYPKFAYQDAGQWYHLQEATITDNACYSWTGTAISCSELTAISADVLYQAADMANITFTSSDQHFTGLSTNNLFKVYGTLNSTDAFGKNEEHSVTDDISKKDFTSALYITAANNTSSTSDPTQGAIEFITPSTSGILYLYLNSSSSGLSIKKKGASSSTSLSGAAYKKINVDANTHYFINGSGSNRGLYGIQYVSTYAVSITPTDVTKETGATGAGAAIKGKTYTATFTANTSYTLPSDVTVTIGGASCTKGTEYTWSVSDGTGTLTVKAAYVTGNIVVNVTGAAPATYSITYDCDGASSGCPTDVAAATNLPSPLPSAPTKDGYTFDGWYTNSEKTVDAVAGATLTGNVTLYAKWTEDASSYSVTYDGNGKSSGDVPTDATAYAAGEIVTVKGNTGNLVKTGQTFLGWSTSATASSGTFYPAGYKFEMPASNVTLYAVWGSAAEEKYYYGQVGITDGALVKGAANTLMFFTNEGGVIASSTALTMTTSNLGTGASCYYNSNDLTHTGLNKSSNWGSSSSANRYIRGLKWANGKSYTLGLGTKVATSIMFYGWAGAADKTLTIGGVEYTSTGTSFFSNDFTKVGNFTDNVTIACGGDFYGILVITISTGAASNFTVSFNMNGHGSAIDAIANVPTSSKIGKPIPDPTAVDWEFGGWYKENTCTNEWNFASDVVNSDKTLYAKWTNCAPTITTQPVAAASYTQNATATALTVAANDNGGGELHYQWWVKENDLSEETGSAIPGETNTSFTPSTELLGTSYYYCVVSNDCGNVFSNTAGITITDAHPNPKAVWNVDKPTHGGKGFNFSVEVNKNDDSNWDGTLEASMLTLSSEAVLDESSIVVDNTNKIISGTYGVKGSATSPVTFYLLLPATTSQAAARLDYDKTFSTCTGGGDGSTYRVPVRKDSEKDASNNYRWVTAGAGEISYTYGSTISSKKATSSYNSFDSIVSSDNQNLYVRTYNANIKKVTLYVLTGGKDITVESIYKQTSYKGADDKDKLSTAAYSVTYDGGSDENTGAKGNHYIVITLVEPLEANDILMFKFSKGNVKAYGAEFTETADDGTETPTLGWSPSIAGNVEKNENAADFTYTATRSNDKAVASLGIISYSSSNTAVATVNATTGQVTIAGNIDFGSADHIDVTITATLSASGCYKKATNTYTLRVKKYVCTEAAGTVTVTSESGCNKVLTISGYEEGASIQWYKDGEVITGAIETSYTATSGGTYYAITHKGCDAVSNELTISTAAATATKIVDEWYVKNGRRTPDIALVQTTNATDFTVTNKSGGATVSDIGGCTFELKEDGVIYLHGTTSTGAAPSGMTPGDMTITITATACSNATPLDIVLHIQAETNKPSIAFVVDGTLRKDGGTATSVLEAKTSERPIWEFLSTYYALTGCNAYWSVNSKELRQYYSQFDAILITDDPNTSTKGTGDVSYVKAFGTMVDVRPVLTMEAYVGKFSDGGWHVYNATPSSPNPRQVEMKLECKNHDIFAGLNPSTMDNVRTEIINGDEYWFVTMVDTTQSPYHNTKDSYEALPALQGFDKTKFSNMLGVGTIKNDELQAGVERQEEPAARMMILGIQNNAMAALTTEGKMVVKNALDYLLKTDMEDVNDCANYFLGTTNNQWNVATNWSRGEVPDFETRARILRPVVVPNNYSTRVARVDIASDGPSKKLSGAECTGSLTISQLGALVVSGKVSRVHAPYYGVNNLMPTRVSDVAILSGTAGNGTLIMDDASGENKAYVQMYSKAVKGSPTTWQYIGIPHSDVGNAMDNYYDSWLYSWSPSAGWEVVPRGGAVTPWTGYCITYPTFGHTYEMEGTLVATADVDIDVPANSYQIIGNSWVAPIQIENFEDEDFGDIPKTVYFFNTGSDTGGSGNVSENAIGATRWAAGTYVAVPIHMAEYYTGEDMIIPSMQGFYVANNTGSDGTLHLDYDKLVRQHGVSNYIQGQMHAPRRIAKASNDPVMLKMIVRGSRYDDRLIVAEREDFTKGHDDGWDGAKWDGSTISPTIWSENENGGVEAVTATPDMEGTIIGFRAGEDNEYTFHFEYDDMAEALYLLDTELNIYTRILTGETYTFHCADKGEHNRFILTRKAPQITTGCEQVGADGGVKAMKFIKDNKLYILMNGVLYDATGKMMK